MSVPGAEPFHVDILLNAPFATARGTQLDDWTVPHQTLTARRLIASTHTIDLVATEERELYAERLRREAQAARDAGGEETWLKDIPLPARVKLEAAWDDAIATLEDPDVGTFFTARTDADSALRHVKRRVVRSLGKALQPWHVSMPGQGTPTDQILSILEAEHEALSLVCADRYSRRIELEWAPGKRTLAELDEIESLTRTTELPSQFRAAVNRILESHRVAFRLAHDGEAIPVESHELHVAVVEPTLHLLHRDPRFAATETAYMKALIEIRAQDAGDAITDAGTALQEALAALGCTGSTLGAQCKSAKNQGILRSNDTPLIDSIEKTINWVATKRNDGEAHHANPDSDLSDAWMLVHVVGALIVRLTEQAGAANSRL
ncbi:MAG: hypothetical protein WAW17_18285 [Rhodococcus sp. (in: high G+C Gram-positive bacteria)]|uniref:hypothetical protein n=1 Tax=Rhodococcus sp. TaxID=1831 RepID=UPI003BB1822A